MAEKDSTTEKSKALEELAEQIGLDPRFLKKFMADGPMNNVDIARRKVGQLYTIGELLEDGSWAGDDFCFGTESMRNLATLIMDIAGEALDCLKGVYLIKPKPEGEPEPEGGEA